MAETAQQPGPQLAEQFKSLTQRVTEIERECKAEHKSLKAFDGETKTQFTQYESHGTRVVALEAEQSTHRGTLQMLMEGLNACDEGIVGLSARNDLFQRSIMHLEMCGTLSEVGYGQICETCRGSLRMVGWLTGRIVACQSCTTTMITRAIQLTATVSSLDTTQVAIADDWCDCCSESTRLFVGWSLLVAGCTVCTTTGDDRGALLLGCIRDVCDNPTLFWPPAASRPGQAGQTPQTSTPRGNGGPAPSDGGWGDPAGGSGASIFGGMTSGTGNGSSVAAPSLASPYRGDLVYKTIADVIRGSNEIAQAGYVDDQALIDHLRAAGKAFERFSRDPTIRALTDAEIETLTTNWGTALTALTDRSEAGLDEATRDLRVDSMIEIHDLLERDYQFVRGGYSAGHPFDLANL